MLVLCLVFIFVNLLPYFFFSCLFSLLLFYFTCFIAIVLISFPRFGCFRHWCFTFSFLQAFLRLNNFFSGIPLFFSFDHWYFFWHWYLATFPNVSALHGWSFFYTFFRYFYPYYLYSDPIWLYFEPTLWLLCPRYLVVSSNYTFFSIFFLWVMYFPVFAEAFLNSSF